MALQESCNFVAYLYESKIRMNQQRKLEIQFGIIRIIRAIRSYYFIE